MTNMVKLGKFEIQDTIYQNQNILPRKYVKNELGVFGFKNNRLLIVNGVKYKNAIGFSINTKSKKLQVSYSVTQTLDVPLSIDIELVTIRKEGSSIVVNIE